MALIANTNNNAVTALIVAYIGGRNVRGVASGIFTVNKIATTIGIAIETITIKVL
jgi:hypothetical protein